MIAFNLQKSFKDIEKNLKNEEKRNSEKLALVTCLANSIAKNYKATLFKLKNDELTREELWDVVPNIYSLIIAPTGSNKSQILKRYTSIFKEQSSKEFRRIAINPTFEGLLKYLEKNETDDMQTPSPILFAPDEFSEILSKDKKTKLASLRSGLIELFDNSYYSTENKSTDSTFVKNGKISILSSIQQTAIQDFCNIYDLETGFLSRFLFVYSEPSTENFLLLNNLETDFDFLKQYRDFITAIENHNTPRVLKFDLDATKLVYRNLKDIESKIIEIFMKDAGDHYRSFLQKSNYYILRLALVFAVCEDPNTETINADAVRKAIDFVNIYLPYSQKVIDLLQEKKTNKILLKYQIQELYKTGNITNIAAFAKGLGISRRYVHKILNEVKETFKNDETQGVTNPKYDLKSGFDCPPITKKGIKS